VLLTRVSGLLVLAFALFLLGSLVLRAPRLYQERRFHPRLSRYGAFAAPVAGAANGFGWTPCLGPVLTSVLLVAATTGSPTRGAALLAAYSAGLGVPFFASGLAFGRLVDAFGWVKRHVTAVTVASAGALAFFGVLLTFNQLIWVTSRLQDAARVVGLDDLIFLG